MGIIKTFKMGKSSKAGSKLPKKEPHGKDDKMSLVYR